MHEVKITTEKLHDLRMLADWQLRELGFDPDSVTAAVLTMEEQTGSCGKNPWPSPKGPIHPSCY